jgi:serine/threonine-protein kinase
MSVVYEARHVKLSRSYAIKRLQTHLVDNQEAMARFEREAQLLAGLRHPNVVEVTDWEVLADGTPCIILEFLHGADLGVRLSRGPLPWEAIARIGDQTMSALALAHRNGITHRDLKPENLFISIDDSGDERIKLLDFGISKLHQDTLGHDDSTREGTVLGTPAYMAPEQLLASPEISDRADVYAVGVMMFQMLTGKSPFGETVTPLALALSQAAAVAPDARSLEPSVPPLLAELVARCLRRSPEERPAALALGGELAAFADGCATPALHTLERDGAVRDRDSAGSVSEATVVGRSGRP